MKSYIELCNQHGIGRLSCVSLIFAANLAVWLDDRQKNGPFIVRSLNIKPMKTLRPYQPEIQGFLYKNTWNISIKQNSTFAISNVETKTCKRGIAFEWSPDKLLKLHGKVVELIWHTRNLTFKSDAPIYNYVFGLLGALYINCRVDSHAYNFMQNIHAEPNGFI